MPEVIVSNVSVIKVKGAVELAGGETVDVTVYYDAAGSSQVLAEVDTPSGGVVEVRFEGSDDVRATLEQAVRRALLTEEG